MGITITCKNPKYDFGMSYHAFFNLRKNIARCINDYFGSLYEKLMLYPGTYLDDGYLVESKAENYINDNPNIFPEEDNDILDFLFESDCEGKIRHKTCKKIADLLEKNYDRLNLKNKEFRYGYHSHEDYKEFIDFLRDCYSHRKNMEWY